MPFCIKGPKSYVRMQYVVPQLVAQNPASGGPVQTFPEKDETKGTQVQVESLQAGKALFSDQYGAVPRQLIRVARAAFVNEQVGFPDTAVQCISINENLPLSVCGFALF